jgi:hypothetical protein
MAWKKWTAARTFIVSGYLVSFAAAVVSTLWFFSLDEGNLPVSYWFQEILFPLASLSTLIAWWFLTKISVSSTGQDGLFRKAFLALSLESLLTSAAYVIPLTQFFRFYWTEIADVLYAIGAFTTACGFLWVASRYSTSAQTNDDALAFDLAIAEQGDNVPLEQVKRDLES